MYPLWDSPVGPGPPPSYAQPSEQSTSPHKAASISHSFSVHTKPPRLTRIHRPVPDSVIITKQYPPSIMHNYEFPNNASAQHRMNPAHARDVTLPDSNSPARTHDSVKLNSTRKHSTAVSFSPNHSNVTSKHTPADSRTSFTSSNRDLSAAVNKRTLKTQSSSSSLGICSPCTTDVEMSDFDDLSIVNSSRAPSGSMDEARGSDPPARPQDVRWMLLFFFQVIVMLATGLSISPLGYSNTIPLLDIKVTHTLALLVSSSCSTLTREPHSDILFV